MPTGKARKPRRIDYDNDRGFINPRAWYRVKQAVRKLGYLNYAEQLEHLEDLCRTTPKGPDSVSPRELLGVAISAFIMMKPHERAEAVRAHAAWTRFYADDEGDLESMADRVAALPWRLPSDQLVYKLAARHRREIAKLAKLNKVSTEQMAGIVTMLATREETPTR